MSSQVISGGLKEARLAGLCALAEECELLEPALLDHLSAEERTRAELRLKGLRQAIRSAEGLPGAPPALSAILAHAMGGSSGSWSSGWF
jgi:hypothetical protein